MECVEEERNGGEMEEMVVRKMSGRLGREDSGWVVVQSRKAKKSVGAQAGLNRKLHCKGASGGWVGGGHWP